MTTVTESDIKELKDFINSRFDELKGNITQVDGQIKGIDGQVKGIDGQIKGIDGQITEIDGQIKGINGHITEINGHIKGIDERLKTLEFGYAKIETRLEDWNPQINKVTDLAEKVGELKNWRQIALIGISATVAAAFGWFVRGGKL